MTADVVSTTLGTPRHAGGGRMLVAGGVLSAWNGAVHLTLPLVYPWDLHTEDLYEPVRWALYAGTIFFGLLLVWAGLLVVVLARRSDLPSAAESGLYGGLAVFWLLGAGYAVLLPFPAPVVRVVLPIFSLVVAGLLLGGLWIRRPRERPQHPTARATARATGRTTGGRR